MNRPQASFFLVTPLRQPGSVGEHGPLARVDPATRRLLSARRETWRNSVARPPTTNVAPPPTLNVALPPTTNVARPPFV